VSAGSRLRSHFLLFEFGRRLGLAPEQAGLLLLPQPVAVALDVDGRGVMQQPVEDGRGDDLVVEDLAPVREALVAGDDEAGPLLATDQESEEEASLRPREGQVAELVEDEHAGIGELLEGPVLRFSWRARTSRPIRLSRVRKMYGMARLDGLDPDGRWRGGSCRPRAGPAGRRSQRVRRSSDRPAHGPACGRSRRLRTGLVDPRDPKDLARSMENHVLLERVAILFLATLPVYAGGQAVFGFADVRQMVPTL
jgi:hypothetical protein